MNELGIEALRATREAIPIHAKTFIMSTWHDEVLDAVGNVCGTALCIGGHMANYLGYSVPMNGPRIGMFVSPNGEGVCIERILENNFGAMQNLWIFHLYAWPKHLVDLFGSGQRVEAAQKVIDLFIAMWELNHGATGALYYGACGDERLWSPMLKGIASVREFTAVDVEEIINLADEARLKKQRRATVEVAAIQLLTPIDSTEVVTNE